MRPCLAASQWPSATSSTATTLNPVSTYAGIQPFRKSTMMRPVGVGFQSPAPTGVVGFTTTAGKPFAAASITSCSAMNLHRLQLTCRAHEQTDGFNVPGKQPRDVPPEKAARSGNQRCYGFESCHLSSFQLSPNFRLAPKTADGSYPACTMQSWHRGSRPWPYFSQGVFS